MEQQPGLLSEEAELTDGLNHSVEDRSVFPPYSRLSVLLHAPIPALVHCIHTLTWNSMPE